MERPTRTRKEVCHLRNLATPNPSLPFFVVFACGLFSCISIAPRGIVEISKGASLTSSDTAGRIFSTFGLSSLDGVWIVDCPVTFIVSLRIFSSTLSLSAIVQVCVGKSIDVTTCVSRLESLQPALTQWIISFDVAMLVSVEVLILLDTSRAIATASTLGSNLVSSSKWGCRFFSHESWLVPLRRGSGRLDFGPLCS